MAGLISLLARFRSDERGAFAMIFAVMAIVLIATAGAAVDFTSLQGTRTRAQVALDSAALALQPTIYSASTTTIKTQAQALLVDRIADTGVTATVTAATVDTTVGQLNLTATVVVPMNFVSMVGVPTITAQIVSVATRKKLNLEVALVLDNSGSMSTAFGAGTRMSNLQADSKCAVNILFYGITPCTGSTTGLTPIANVKMALVPFNAMVNVGSGNASATWLDRSGGSNTFDNNNFDSNDDATDIYSGTTDRIALFNGLTSSSNGTVPWGGCVEARINTTTKPYDTNDTTPNTLDHDTLFTPLFAPDEPDTGGYGNSYISDTPANCPVVPTCVRKIVITKCDSSGNNCTGTTTTTYSNTSSSGVVTTTACSAVNASTVSDTTALVKVAKNNYTSTRSTSYSYPPHSFSARVLQERLCKYTGAKLTAAVKPSSGFGPNSQCPASAIQPLTSTPATVVTAINGMAAMGNTNIQEGAAWGFRVLSPTAPFTEGLAYDAATSKVMIIMTDGENTFSSNNSNMNYADLYSAYAYPYNNLASPNNSNNSTPGRMGTTTWADTDYEAEINRRLGVTCTNAKAVGITIYTIGLATSATSDPAGNTLLLQNCATDTTKAFFPVSAADLSTTFQTIANELADLRLAQ